jgi:plastocyanin
MSRLTTPTGTRWRLVALPSVTLGVGLPLALLLAARPARTQGHAAGVHAEGAAPVSPSGRAEGRIEGRIRVGRTLDARRPRFRIYSDAGAAAVPAGAAGGEESAMQGVVVWLEGVPRGTVAAPGAAPGAAPAAARVEQKDERFAPRVLPVLAGTTVAFPNGDAIYHNVFSLSSARTFDLGRYPRGESKSVRFDRPGVVQVFCHIHSDMRAVVLVLDTPAFTMPSGDGRYAIAGVPPGEYTLVAWHERAAPIRRKVRVSAGGTAVEDVDIPIVDETPRD